MMDSRSPDALPTVRDLLSPDGLRDPYAIYDRFRRAEAAGRDIGHVVVGYDQVVGLLGDRRLSSERVDAILEPLGPDVRGRCPFAERTLQSIVAFRDPPDHTRIRSLLASTFSPRMVKQLGELIEGISARLLDAVVADGETDLHRAYSYPLPALVVGAMLGIPEPDVDRFKSWARDIVFLVGSGSPSERLAVAAEEHFGEMRTYLGALVQDRRHARQPDLLSAMIDAADHGARLSEDEIFANATFLMTAGHETVTNMLSNGVLSLLRHPDQLERLRGERSLTAAAAEEILRFESPVQMTSRRATADGEFAGRRVKAGEALQLFLGAANRDPARFPDPDRFDIARGDNRHVAFGFGPHFCLGAALAREELRVALDHVLDRLPGLELAVDEVAWQPTIDFRGPLALPVRWRPGSR
jgi:pimeloyl-[acyl-carrier protein] synthase